MHPFGITAEVFSAAKDRLGDEVLTLVGKIDGCAFAPGLSTEDNDKRSQTSTAAELYCGSLDIEVTSQHQIQVAGDMWHVDGTPQRWDRPYSGGGAGSVMVLRRVKG